MATDALVIDRAPVAEALTWPERATALVVSTPEQYVGAAELLKGLKALRQTIVDTFSPHAKRLHEAHKAIVAEQRAAEDPLTRAELTIKAKLLDYDREQERIRREAEAKAREEARRAEEARRLEEAAAMELEAVQTGDAALAAEAEAFLAEPIVAPVISIPKETPKVTGISYRETWGAELVDLMALVRHVATHPEHLNLLAANMPAINGLARSLRSSLAIPGIRAVSKREIASGR